MLTLSIVRLDMVRIVINLTKYRLGKVKSGLAGRRVFT